MAVKIHEYFERYRHATLPFFMLVQILSAIAAGTVAWVFWDVLRLEPLLAFALGLSALVIINAIVAPMLFKRASEPLKVLSQAIAHVSKDPVVTPPPDIRAKRFTASGLKEMVQTVYELAVASYPEDGKQPAKTSPQTDFFRHIVDSIPAGVIAIGQDGKVVYANSTAPASATPDGTYALDLIFEQNDDVAKWLADCQANKVRDSHVWIRVADKVPGEEGRRIFDVAGYYQKNDNAGVEAVLVAFDRTAQYADDQEDMDFIALAAHELRGPITVIRGYLEVLKQELGSQLTDDQQALIDRLQVSAERLSGYVNNILNVSRYDRHTLKVHLHEEKILDVIETLVPDLALRAKTQNRRLSFHIPPEIPTIAADRSSLSEVLTNLIDNAIKYSHEGGEVVISATPKEKFVEVTVQDSGIGMPASVVSNLFNRFYRSHRSKQTVSGTGLGLYICKTIVESHGGTIWVRSKEGEGSTFGFTVPTYASVADKLKSGNNEEKDITQRTEGWIKNHAMISR
ncbi:MAG: ATP-binding protein [Candidatus Saccharimonadales bacterium]